MLDRSRWAALLIGTSQADPSIGTSAPAVLDNLDTLAKVLRDPAAVGIPADSVMIVADPNDLGTVFEPLTRLARTDLNVLLVYYSGHGMIDEDGRLRLSLTGTTKENVNWHSVSAVQLTSLLNGALAQTRILIVDSCYSGKLAGPESTVFGVNSATARADLDMAGAVTIASVPPNMQAWVEPKRRYTTFTGALLVRMRGGAPALPDDYLDLETVFQLTRSDLLRAKKPLPQILNANQAHRLPFALNGPRPLDREPRVVQLLYGPDEIDWVRVLARNFGARDCRLRGMPPRLSALVRGNQGGSTTSAPKAHELVRTRWDWEVPDRVPRAWAILELRDEQPSPSDFSNDAQLELTRQAAGIRASAAATRGIPVILVRRDARSNPSEPISILKSETEESSYRYVIDLVSDTSEPESRERGQVESRVWSLPEGWGSSILDALAAAGRISGWDPAVTTLTAHHISRSSVL
jgi:Caspase domain